MRVTMLMVAASLLATPLPAAAQQPAPSGAASGSAQAVTLIPGIQGVHFAISTRRDEAQKFFDQGLALVYASNLEEAVRSFQRAAEIDPGSPMPHWGIAVAYAQNLGDPPDPARVKAGADASLRATELAARAPAKERAFAAAVAKRYPTAPGADANALAVEYKDAMRQLARTYPNDSHAATLYAASLIALRPGELYTPEGTPAEGTAELVEVLERVLEREPDHVGANYYFIVATESSLTPERGLKSAKKLETLMPGAGYLLHMPAHTYLRTGNYAGALAAVTRAADVDRPYVAGLPANSLYASEHYPHVLSFVIAAAMMDGRFADALKAGQELTTRVTPLLATQPAAEPMAAQQMLVLVRFAKWKDALALPAPPEANSVLTALHHFGRGVAQAMLGNAADAEKERDAFRAARSKVSPAARFNRNPAAKVLAVADAVLEARLTTTRGDAAATITAWKKAVEAEDQLGFAEPPDWFYPVRESLGIALMRAKRYEEADLAFREDLERNPNNGRSLWGRWQALRAADGDVTGTQVVRRRWQDAWNDADVTLRLEDF